MQNLRDQLLKAKLIDRKTKKKADQAAKADRRKKGHDAVVAEEAARAEAFEEKRATQSKQDRRRERRRQERLRADQARLQLRQLVLDGIVTDRRGGPRRFYFVTRNGRIPFLQVSDELGRTLESGRVAIVEVPQDKRERFEVVSRETAQQLAAEAPDFIRFWNGQGPAQKQVP